MPKYLVQLEVVKAGYVEIEAESEEQAREKAEDNDFNSDDFEVDPWHTGIIEVNNVHDVTEV